MESQCRIFCLMVIIMYYLSVTIYIHDLLFDGNSNVFPICYHIHTWSWSWPLELDLSNVLLLRLPLTQRNRWSLGKPTKRRYPRYFRWHRRFSEWVYFHILPTRCNYAYFRFFALNFVSANMRPFDVFCAIHFATSTVSSVNSLFDVNNESNKPIPIAISRSFWSKTYQNLLNIELSTP